MDIKIIFIDESNDLISMMNAKNRIFIREIKYFQATWID